MAGFDWDKVFTPLDTEKLGTMWGIPPSKKTQAPPTPVPTVPEVATPAPVAIPQLTAAQEQLAAGGIVSPGQNLEQTPPPAAMGGSAPPTTAPVPMQALQQTTRVTQQAPLTPAEKQAEAAAVTKQEEAIRVKQFAESEAAKQSALLLQQQNDTLEAQAIENEKQRQQDAKRSEAAMAKFDQALEDFSKARVNPNRAYENMGVGGRILATIGQALGAFGGAITHSPNYAQQMIDRAIDADIRAQEGEIAKLGQRVNMQQNRVAYFRQQGLDKESARVAARVSLMQSTQAKIQELLATSQSQEALAVGEQLVGALQQAQIDKIAKRKGEIVSETVRAPTAGVRQGEQLPASEAEKIGTANAAIKAAQELYKDWDTNARGVFGYISSLLPMTDASRFNDYRQMTKQIIGSYLEGGVLRKEDEAKYEKYLPAAGDSLATGRNKRDRLIGLVASRAEEQRRALREAGFNVDKIKVNKPVTTFTPMVDK